MTDLGAARYHSVVFHDLDPSTTYAYRVGDGVNWSEWVHARTASETPEPFTFIYFGDAQTNLKSLWSRVIRGAYSDASGARFIVHAGDLVNSANRDAQWGEWFGAGGWVNAMIPSVPTPATTSTRSRKPPKTRPRPGPTASKADDAPKAEPPVKATLSRHWRPQFTLPRTARRPGGDGLLRRLPGDEDRLAQLQPGDRGPGPLDRGGAGRQPEPWTVITFHHPIYSPARDRDNPKLRNLWQPLFDRYKVDLVLQGHDHTYARTGLAFTRTWRRARPTATTGGTVYVVSVSGPKMYDLTKGDDRMTRSAEDTQLYQIITVDGDTLRYQARTAVGDLYDAFDLRKRPGGPNELIEKVPDIPERRRPVPTPAPAAADVQVPVPATTSSQVK